MLRRYASAVALFAIALAPATSSAQSCQTMGGNLIQNCSFELGTVRTGADYPDAVVSSWTPLGGPQGGTFERWANGYDNFFAQDGISHIELQVNGPTRISQGFLTNVGERYSLDFWSAHRPQAQNGFSQIDVYLNSTFLVSTGQIFDAYDWQKFDASFIGVGNETLEFRSMGNQLSYGDFLDNVSVVSDVGTTAVVPEPSTFALMAAGFGLVGMVGRRKRNTR